ncbi:MAG: ComF family protein [Pseudomonadota bacterium]
MRSKAPPSKLLCGVNDPSNPVYECLACRLPSGRSRLCRVCLADAPILGEQVDGSDRGRRVVAVPHQGRYRYWVHRLKYRNDFDSGRVLALLLAVAVQDSYAAEGQPLPEALLPVPLHWRRRLRRGYNQSEVLAHELSQLIDRPLWPRALQRPIPADPQQGLDRDERLTNLNQAFLARPQVNSRHLALIDDVYTTGATSTAAANALYAAGATRVDVWCATLTTDPHTHRHTHRGAEYGDQPQPSRSSHSSSKPK